VLRTAGFALLGLVDTLPALLVASAATGFAGALFNPAVRAYLACDAADRRIEAFAIFNIFYQAGILAGPLIGLALVAVNFQLVCLTAAAVFALLTVVQLRWLPARRATTDTGAPTGVWVDWRSVLANRPFLLFACAMAGSYVLSFQIYLLLPLTLGRHLSGQFSGALGSVGLIFAVSALTAIAGQLRIADWARLRWSAPAAVTRGLLLMAASFLPLVTYAMAPHDTGPAGLLTAVIACTVLLTLGSALIYPFEMDTVVGLSAGRLVATHYGLYNTIAGIAIAAGNLLSGALLDAAGTGPLPWIILTALGAACGGAVHLLARGGRLVVPGQPQQATV
jgi:MFS family permease